jgi:hypothetical protein
MTGRYTEWREFLRRRQTPTIDEYREDDQVVVQRRA